MRRSLSIATHGTMTAKNRNKSSSQPGNSDKTLASPQPEDAPKTRSPRAPRAESNASGSPLLKLLSALCYLGFVAGTVIASVCFYRELSEIKHASARHEQSVQRSADALQQIRSMQASLEALESAVHSVRTDLERTGRAAQKGEDNTRQLEDSLHKLQSKVSQELAQAVREVKEAREPLHGRVLRAAEPLPERAAGAPGSSGAAGRSGAPRAGAGVPPGHRGHAQHRQRGVRGEHGRAAGADRSGERRAADQEQGGGVRVRGRGGREDAAAEHRREPEGRGVCGSSRRSERLGPDPEPQRPAGGVQHRPPQPGGAHQRPAAPAAETQRGRGGPAEGCGGEPGGHGGLADGADHQTERSHGQARVPPALAGRLQGDR